MRNLYFGRKYTTVPWDYDPLIQKHCEYLRANVQSGGIPASDLCDEVSEIYALLGRRHSNAFFL